jgi:pimeloyl-ACP methyl ester carboxylesterase
VNAAAYGARDWRARWVDRFPGSRRWLVEDATNLTDRLQSIEVPTFLLFGELDDVAPVALGRVLFEQIPESSFQVIRPASHDILAEHPEKVARLIVEHQSLVDSRLNQEPHSRTSRRMILEPQVGANAVGEAGA